MGQGEADPAIDGPATARSAWWHAMFAIDLRSLAAVRIGAGVMLLWDLASRSRFLTQFYTDAGATPRSLFADPSDRWRSLYFLVGSRAAVSTLFALHAVFAAMLALGLFTRLAILACVAFTWSLVNRNVHVMHGGDELLIWMMIWLLFLPADRVMSLDRLRRRSKGLSTDVSGSICSPASAGLLLQIVFVYWGAVAARVAFPEWWSNLSAVHYFLRSFNGTPLGQRLADAGAFTRIATAGTMLWESLAAPIALACYRAPRVRTAIVVLFILFHFGLGRLIYLGTFESICMVAWLSFVPSQTWDALRWKLPANAEPGPRSPGGWPETKLAAAVASVILVFVLTVNFVNDVPPRIARQLGPLSRMPKLKQWWAVMGRPEHEDADLITTAILSDGTSARLDPPEKCDGVFVMLFPQGDVRVRRYRRTILEAPKDVRQRLLASYCEWQCRQWDATHAAKQHVQQITVSAQIVKLPAFDADEILAGFPIQSTQTTFVFYNWSPPQRQDTR